MATTYNIIHQAPTLVPLQTLAESKTGRMLANKTGPIQDFNYMELVKAKGQHNFQGLNYVNYQWISLAWSALTT